MRFVGQIAHGAVFGVFGYCVFRAMGGPSHFPAEESQLVASTAIGMAMYVVWRVMCLALTEDGSRG